MEQENVDMFLMLKGNFFPKEMIILIRERLVMQKNIQWTDLLGIKLKDPFFALLISVAGGVLGVDRFYLQEHMVGICKLSLTLMVYVLSVMGTMQTYTNWSLVIVQWIGVVMVLIWYFIDLSQISRKVRGINYQFFLTCLNQNNYGTIKS